MALASGTNGRSRRIADEGDLGLERLNWAAKASSRSQSNDGYRADCGRSRGGLCRGAIRPIEASKAAICYVRNPSIVLKNSLASGTRL